MAISTTAEDEVAMLVLTASCKKLALPLPSAEEGLGKHQF